MADRQSTSNNMMLREKYNTTIEMVGNTAFLPGSSIFLDPNPLDLGFSSNRDSFARKLGLGGLYMVNYVDHQIDFISKSWTTTLDTKWESYGDGQAGSSPTNTDPCDDLRDAVALRGRDLVAMYESGLQDANARAALAQASITDAGTDTAAAAAATAELQEALTAAALYIDQAASLRQLEDIQDALGTTPEYRSTASNHGEVERDLELLQNSLRRLRRNRRTRGLSDNGIDPSLYMPEGSEEP